MLETNKFILFLTSLLFFSRFGLAQLPTDFRTEQIFLTTDKVDYAKDDTIRVEGVVTALAHNHSAPYSRLLYVELINPRTDSVVARQNILCDEKGLFRTTFLSEPDADKGDYFLRAYTNLMRNFNSDAFALRHITVGAPTPPDDGVIDDDIQCRILPMGNRLIPDRPQQIAAVLLSPLGYPVTGQNLALVTAAGDTIEQRHTSASGYAVFNFIPRSGESYALRFSAMGVNKSFPVPDSDKDAYRIAGAISGQRLRFAIEGTTPPKHRIFSFDRSNGLSEISTSATSGVTDLNYAPSGPVTIFLTDNNLNIVSQTTLLPKTDFNPELSLADTVTVGSAADFHLSGINRDSVTILARFIPAKLATLPLAEADMQTSDFDSPLPLPVNSISKPEGTTDLQAWLGAATFRRFDLVQAVKNDSAVYRYMPQQTMSISGIVYDDDNAKHPMKGGRLVAYNAANRLVTDTCVAKDGRFTVDVDYFKDGTEFFLQAINSKGVLIRGVIKVDDTSYPAIGTLPTIGIGKKRYAESITEIDAEEKGGDSRALPNVTVKARVIRADKRIDKKFYGVRYVDYEFFEKYNSQTVLDALRRMAFIRVVLVSKSLDDDPASASKRRSNSDPMETYYVIVSTRNGGTLPMIFDGTVVDDKRAQQIFEMPIMQIESIEQLSTAEALMHTTHALNGAISILTKKLGAPPLKDAKGIRCWPPGLTDTTIPTETALKAPEKPGDYTLDVDIITPDGNVKSLTRNVTVIP